MTITDEVLSLVSDIRQLQLQTLQHLEDAWNRHNEAKILLDQLQESLKK